MKKFLLFAAAAIIAAGALQAKAPEEFRIYLNPGHGSYGANDRPMKTIGHPNTGVLNAEGTTWIDTDTLGFYEGRGTLPRTFGIADYLKKVGVKPENIVFSRLKNGPWPYTTPNSEYDPDHLYNKDLADICEEVEEGNFDMFISCHSNASTDGTSTNYPLILYRGNDNDPGVEGSDLMAKAVWPYHWMGEIEPMSHYSKTSANCRGDISFYGSSSTATRNNGKRYTGYLGVLKHGVPGFLNEGYFHTYQPGRHRGLNFDYDRLEGLREARGVCAYFNFAMTGNGEIAGTVRDMHEKIVHNLYHYAYGSEDQWTPLNGAVVTLKKGGEVVGTYQCDNEWNGFFSFTDLEPGDYTVEATVDGYKPLEEPIAAKVTANETCFKVVKLENVNYVPEEEVFVNYPDPDQPNYLKLPDEFVFTKDEGNTYEGMVGVIAQTLQYGDTTIVLTHDGRAANIYAVNNVTKEVKEINTDGLFNMPDNPGFYNEIGSIALSADHKLVGVTAVRTSFADSNVPSGYQRGTMHAYYWEDFDAEPTDWFSTKYSSNWYNSDLGWGVAVSGTIDECIVCVPAPTSGSTRGVRPAFFVISEGNVVSTSRANANATITMVGLGDPMATEGNIDNYPIENFGRIKVAVSPFNDRAFIIGGSKGKMYEFEIPADGGVPACKVFPETEEVLGNGMQFFKYAGSVVMAAPYGTAQNVKGLKLFKVNGGIDNVTMITTNTDLAEPAGDAPLRAITAGGADFAWSGAMVNKKDINAYLIGNDANIVKFTTAGEAQPVVKNIMAYDLRMTEENGDYTFTFKSNDDAQAAYLIFMDGEGNEVGSIEIPNVKAGENTITVANADLPGEGGVEMNWAVNVVGKAIADIGLLNNPNDFTFTRIGNVVDNSPESEYFGRLYLVNRIGSDNSGNGIWVYNNDLTPVNTTAITGEYLLGNPFRLATDENGMVYLANWADGARSGVYKLNPVTLSGDLEPFFIGTHAASGAITTANGDVICTSTPSVFIAGKGANTHMYCHLEDYNNDISQYNIGNEDGTIKENWSEAASRFWGIGGKLISTHAAVIGETPEGGIWVVQNRSAGNNNAGVPSIMYVNAEGTIVYNSGTEGNPIHEYLSGTQYCAGAISADGKEMIVNQPDGTLKFFAVEYDESGVPSLTWKYDYKHGVGTLLTQINYDYAGNIYVSGSKLAIISMPTDDNQTTTPAMKKLVVMKVPEVKMVTVTGVITSISDPRSASYYAPGDGEPVEGATVTFSKDDEKYSDITDSEGAYEVTMPAGDGYKMTVTKDGYVTYEKDGLNIDLDETGAAPVMNVGIEAEPTAINRLNNENRIFAADGNIVVKAVKPTRIIVTDMAGRTLRDINVNAGTTTIGELPAGVYVVNGVKVKL